MATNKMENIKVQILIIAEFPLTSLEDAGDIADSLRTAKDELCGLGEIVEYREEIIHGKEERKSGILHSYGFGGSE